MSKLEDLSALFDRAIRPPLTLESQSFWDAYNHAAYGNVFKGAAKYIGQEAVKNRVTILADSNHGNIHRRAFIASPELMVEARKAGITHLGLEIPYHHQPLIDELVSGRINKGTYVNIMLAFADAKIIGLTGVKEKNLKRDIQYDADTILNAAQNGLKVVAIDTGIGKTVYYTKDGKSHFDGHLSAEAPFIKDFILFARESPYFNTSISTLLSSDFGMIERRNLLKKAYNESPSINDFRQNILATSHYQDLKIRLRTDYVVARNIANAIGSSGKMLIDYGSMHSERQTTDIDSTLNRMGIPTKVIDVHGTTADFFRAACVPKEDLGGCEGRYAHDRIFLDPKHATLEKAEQNSPPVLPPISLIHFNR